MAPQDGGVVVQKQAGTGLAETTNRGGVSKRADEPMAVLIWYTHTTLVFVADTAGVGPTHGPMLARSQGGGMN